VDTYGIDSTDVEFDPLFDLDGNGDLYTQDFALFQGHFAEGGTPATDPPGQNPTARVGYEIVPGEPPLKYLNVHVLSVSNLAGYSFRVTYPSQTLTLIEVSPDGGASLPNILNRVGGLTPLFVGIESAPGNLWIANAIKRATETTAPEGDGFLAQITFSGQAAEAISVSDIVLMDHQRLLNYLSQGGTLGEHDTAVLTPYLFQNRPNPFSAATVLRFQVPQRVRVTLKAYDVVGRLVRTLLDEYRDPGVHALVWDGADNEGHPVMSGLYFYRFDIPGYTESRRMVLVR